MENPSVGRKKKSDKSKEKYENIQNISRSRSISRRIQLTLKYT